MKKNLPPHLQPESSNDVAAQLAQGRKTMPAQTVWRGLATMGALGFTLVGCTFFGLFIGYNVDRWLKTSPWLTIIFLLLGIVAGFLNIFFSAVRSPRRKENNAVQVDPNGMQ